MFVVKGNPCAAPNLVPNGSDLQANGAPRSNSWALNRCGRCGERTSRDDHHLDHLKRICLPASPRGQGAKASLAISVIPTLALLGSRTESNYLHHTKGAVQNAAVFSLFLRLIITFLRSCRNALIFNCDCLILSFVPASTSNFERACVSSFPTLA